MIGRLSSVVLECPDTQSLAEFYRAILGGTITSDGEWIDLVLPGKVNLSFQHVPGFVAPVWPGSDGDQQLHLDIEVEDFEVAERDLLAVGARPVASHEGFRVYLDLAGHPFCTVN